MDIPSRRLPLGVTMTIGNNGFQITIIHTRGGWEVAYPVIPEHQEQETQGNWTFGPAPFKPGHMPQWATMPLMEFLNLLAEEYKLPHVLVANI